MERLIPLYATAADPLTPMALSSVANGCPRVAYGRWSGVGPAGQKASWLLDTCGKLRLILGHGSQ